MFKIKSILSTIAILFLILSCNSDESNTLKDNYTNTIVADTSYQKTHENDMATVKPNTIQPDSLQFIPEIDNKLSHNINLAKTVMNLSTDEATKNLAKTISDQLTELHNKLKNIAEAKNINLPTSLSQSMQDAINIVTAKKGKQLDSSYLDWVITDTKAINDWLETEIRRITDEQIKQFATIIIPIIEQHHDAAVALKNKD